mmetsp:Transcript_1222/g.2016  ORF Transcript_1222/g.2016 Transcript_1222/m.2016 type:complete len:271 (+) Transcript_1222:26-838(+)
MMGRPLHAEPSELALSQRRCRARKKLLSQGVAESDLPFHLQRKLHFCPNRVGRKCNCKETVGPADAIDSLAAADALDSLVEVASTAFQLQQNRNLKLETTQSSRPRESDSFTSPHDPSIENLPVSSVSGDLIQVLNGSKESAASSFFEWTEDSLADARNKLNDGGVHQLTLRLKMQAALQAFCPDMTPPVISEPDEPASSSTLSFGVYCCKTGSDQGFKLVSEPVQLSEEDLNGKIVDRLLHFKSTTKKRKVHIESGKQGKEIIDSPMMK